MKQKLFKTWVLVFSLSTLGTGSFYLWKFKKSVDGLKGLPEVRGADSSEASHAQSSEQHAAEGKGKVAQASGEHGGGHGEPQKTEAGHGAAPAKESGHGGEHGKEGERSPASVVSKGVPIFSLDEVYVNVNSNEGAHMMGLKLELEMFEENQRGLLKSRQSGVRDRVIELSRGFDYEKIKSLGGKLYFKEMVVSSLNEFFGQALIKNVHISSFYLQ